MKKKFIIGVIIFLLIAIAILTLFVTNFYNTTLSSADMEKYCIDHSQTKATSFKRFETQSEPLYAFWVSTNAKTQEELFIFKNTFIGNIDLDRFAYVNQVTSHENANVGSVKFAPRDKNGKKTNVNMLVYYSSNKSQISQYVIDYQENGDMCTRKGQVTSNNPFIVCIPQLGTLHGMVRKFESIQFFDRDGNLISIEN